MTWTSNPLKSKQLTNIRHHLKDEAGEADPDRADDPGTGDGPISRTMSWWK